MFKKILYTVLFIITFSASAAVNVAVGTAPEKYIVEKIGGDLVNVYCIMPEEKNPHDFSVTPGMIKKAAQCQVFFHTRLLFEEQIAKMLSQSGTRVWDLSLNVAKIVERNNQHDEHVWFSYNSLYRMAIEAEKVLSEIDGANARYYFQNRVNFCNQITYDRSATRRKLNTLPYRMFITHHAAFGYFAVEFNLHQHAFEFNGREITPKNLANLSRLAKKHRIKKIFIQSTAPENVRRAIQNATGASLVIINPSDYDVLDNMNKFAAELEASFE